MPWRLTGDIDEFLTAAGEFLASRPVEHTNLLTIAAKIKVNGPFAYGPNPPLFGSWHSPSDTVEGALVRTPPRPVMISGVTPDAATEAAAALHEADPDQPGVNIVASALDPFVAEWHRLTGAKSEVHMRVRLYRLAELTMPDPLPSGRARLAAPADRELLIDWFRGFHEYIHEPLDEYEQYTDNAIASGRHLVWESQERPVAMATRSAPAAGMGRILQVYTPPELRGRGYAGAVTAYASQAALDEGVTDVVLNTDLTNPTSNALYQRLGYRPVEDRTVVTFS